MFSTPSRERVNKEYAKCVALVGGVGRGGVGLEGVGRGGGGWGGWRWGVKVNYWRCESGQYLRDVIGTFFSYL